MKICIYVLFLNILLNIKSERVKRECEQPKTSVWGSNAPNDFCANDLIFEDNFDWLDLEKWQHEITLYGGGNHEFQWYTNDANNSFVSNGNLHIKPSLTSDYLGGEDKLYYETIDLGSTCTNDGDSGCKRTGSNEDVLNPIRSARLHTMHSFGFKYGKVEIRAKMPTGDWLWPAMWFMPVNSVYGLWPRSGEIDLSEVRGNQELWQGNENIGVDTCHNTLHWGPDETHDAYYKTAYTQYKSGSGYNSEFRNYELMWTPDFIRFTIDGQSTGTADPGTTFWDLGEFSKQGLTDNPWAGGEKMTPFDQEFFIILNLAVGGTNGYFPDDAKNVPYDKPWQNTQKHAMTEFWKAKDKWLPTWKLNENNAYQASLVIDYVRVWAI